MVGDVQLLHRRAGCCYQECVQRQKAALSCRVVMGAGSSCQGGSSDAGASSGQTHLLLLLLTDFVSFILPPPSVPSVPLVLGFAPGVDGGASER